MNHKDKKFNIDNNLFILIFVLMFTVFIFTSDGHRYTFDEDVTQQQTKRIVTQEPHPSYVEGKSRMLFEYSVYFPFSTEPICHNAILCSPAYIGHSLTQVPFVFINQVFHIITQDTVFLTEKDFDDPHYVWWRNSINPDFTFLELFYGPLFSALSVGTFFLVCRTFNFERRNSVFLSVVYGLSTLVWAYSKTSLNVQPMTFFILLGFLFFRKFQKNQSSINLLICGISMGFGFLVRLDAVLFIAVLFLFLLYNLRGHNEKIKKFFSFVIPTAVSYSIYLIINFIRIGTSPISGVASSASTIGSIGSGSSSMLMGITGLLVSPGAGLLIFSPILLTIFFTFPDFYKRNRNECLLFLAFAAFFLIFYGDLPNWHGMSAWGSRYLIPIIPFFLLPLGASIEKRKTKVLMSIVIVLAITGAFFNVISSIQDVPWFVWGLMGGEWGLYKLGDDPTVALGIHPVVLWTFEYSQLTHAIILFFNHLQLDIFLLKALGSTVFGLLFSSILITSIYLLYRLLHNKPAIVSINQD